MILDRIGTKESVREVPPRHNYAICLTYNHEKTTTGSILCMCIYQGTEAKLHVFRYGASGLRCITIGTKGLQIGENSSMETLP